MNNIVQEFIEQCISRLNENTPKIITCLDDLTEDQIWYKHNEASNSIANMVLHLCGNIRQYAISSLGDQPDQRNRDLEFSARGGYTPSELKDKLVSTVKEAIATIGKMDETSLMKLRSVQGFSLSGMGIIIHVTEHYSYHTGQIVMLTKLFKNKNFDFYAGMDLNAKNKTKSA